MRLRLGQPVNGLDGPYGELGDIVVDPIAKTVTHLVIEPHRKHRLARLVPMWMIESNKSEPDSDTLVEDEGSSDSDIITIQLDVAHIHQLQAASFADYVRYTDPIDLGEQWDIGTEDVVSTPYPEIDAGLWGGDGRMNIEYDRIPRGEVEIRRRSTVASSDDHELGHVVGMVVDGEDVTGIAVRSGIPGRRHDSFVTMDKIAGVRNDRVLLSIERDDFKKLPTTEAFDDGEVSLAEMSRERVDAAVGMVNDAGHHLMDRARSALHRHD